MRYEESKTWWLLMPKDHYGSDESGGFNALSKAYKNDPSIENYVRLRRENPDGEIEVRVTGGIDQLFFMEPELEKYGISPDLVASALDADHDSVGELSLQLLEKIIAARELQKAGETHIVSRGLAIPNKLIDWLIAMSLDAMSWTDDLTIPRDLIVLIRERLGGANLEYELASASHQKKMNAAIIAGQLKSQGIRPTLKILASALNVAPSTVKRWFEPGELEREADKWSRGFDEHGNFKPIGKWGAVAKKPLR